jgi:hypothetical protein
MNKYASVNQCFEKQMKPPFLKLFFFFYDISIFILLPASIEENAKRVFGIPSLPKLNLVKNQFISYNFQFKFKNK